MAENIYYRLLFLTTHTDNNFIHGLLSSLTESNKNIKVGIIVLSQNGLQNFFTDYKTDFLDIYQIGVDSQIGLSLARNQIISYISVQHFEFDFVMFPDDDSIFDKYFFENFDQIVENGKNYLIDVYCKDGTTLFKKNSLKDNQVVSLKHYDAAMSVNMIICAKTFKQVGYFDENLGVGAQYGAGEDVDYFIRIIKMGEYFYYTSQLRNFHPQGHTKHSVLSSQQLRLRLKKYGEGAIHLFCKHRLWKAAIVCCIRALLGGIIKYSQLEIKLGNAYFYAFYYRIKALWQEIK